MLKKVKKQCCYIGNCAFGTDLLDELTAVCVHEHIHLGRIEAIGAVQNARFGYYDQTCREYHYIEISRHAEIVCCVGNISLDEGKPMVHAHITLADEKGMAFGGHLTTGTKVFAAEYTIQAYENEDLSREFDATTGLRLWKCE